MEIKLTINDVEYEVKEREQEPNPADKLIIELETYISKYWQHTLHTVWKPFYIEQGVIAILLPPANDKWYFAIIDGIRDFCNITRQRYPITNNGYKTGYAYIKVETT